MPARASRGGSRPGGAQRRCRCSSRSRSYLRLTVWRHICKHVSHDQRCSGTGRRDHRDGGHGLRHRPGRRTGRLLRAPRRRAPRGGRRRPRAPRRDPGPAGRQGQDQPGRRRRGHRPADRHRDGLRPPAVRPGDRGDPRGPRRQAGDLHRAGGASAGRHPAGEQHLQPGRQRHRRRHRPPGSHPRPALLQPAAADAPGRGGPRGPDRRRGARAGHGAGAGVGQDAGAVHLDARLHRQPGRPPLLRRGPADGRGGRGRPRHHRLRPA